MPAKFEGTRPLSRRATALFFAVALLAPADTLVLRNGAIVSGAWAGVDTEKISFLMNHQLQTYPRSDVLSVTFGPEAPAPTQPTNSAIPLPNAPIAGVVEPELIGVVYLQDASGKLTPLERAKAQLKRIHWEVASATSPVRLKTGQKTLFVVSLAKGIDPATFILAGVY